MYIRRKVFSILDTEIGERLFSTTDYILDQREFTGETKRRNKALKRQWFEKMGGISPELGGGVSDELQEKGKSQFINKIDLEAAGKVRAGRNKEKLRGLLQHDHLDTKEYMKKRDPEMFKKFRELQALELKKAKKSESKLSKLAKNKYAKGAAGLLVLGGTAAGGYYLLNKKKNKKDKEDKD